MVSIIIPCYNQAHFLEETLNSVFLQTYSNWECIIVNDGSPDNTEEVVSKWQKKDERFKYIEKENGGLSSARNAGIEKAKGDFYLFLDSDDIILPQKLEKSMTALSEESSDVVITNFLRLKNASGNTKRAHCALQEDYFTFENVLLKWDTVFTFPPHCILIASSFIKNKRFNEVLKAKEDWVMWLEVFAQQPKVSYLDEVLVHYRIHKTNMTKQVSHMQINYIKAVKYILEHIPENYKLQFLTKILKDNSRDIESNLKKVGKYKKVSLALGAVLLLFMLTTISLLIILWIQFQ